MKEPTEPLNARRAVAQVDLQHAIASIGDALQALAKTAEAGVRRREEAREVAAVFELYRAMKAADTPAHEPMSPEAREIEARLRAAVHGYEPPYLELLSDFALWLYTTVGAERKAR